MSMFLRLFRVELKQRLGTSSLRASFRENKVKFIGRLSVWLIAFLSIAFLVGGYTWLLIKGMPFFAMLNLESVLLGILLLMSMVMVFFLGLFYLIGMLFFAKNTEFLASLPIPQGTVFAVKFSQVLLSEIATGLVILLPPIIVYGVQSGVGVMYWLRAFCIAVLAPSIPLAIAGLLSLLLMRFTALWRRRDLVTVVGSILLMALFILGQTWLTGQMPENMTQGVIMAMLTSNEGLLRMISSAFPPSGWAAQGLISGGEMFWLFVGVSVLSLVLVSVIANHMYYAGAAAQLESTSSTRKVSISGRNVRRHSSVMAIFIREWRTVLRSPTYALNGLVSIIVGPIMMILPRMVGGGDEGFDALMSMLANASIDPLYIVMITAAIIVFIGVINPALSTALSREGKMYYFSRMMPVSPTRQVMGKFLFGMSVSLITVLLMGIASIFTLGYSLEVAGLSAALAVVAIVPPLALAMLPDILHPKLQWNSETEAIKQNANAIIGMVLSWGYMALVIFGIIKLLDVMGNVASVVWILVGVSVVLGAGLIFALGRASRRSLRTIEG